MWVLVKVDHGDADRIIIESYPTFEETKQRINDMKAMVLEDVFADPIREQNEIYDCDCGCQDESVYWWNVTFESGLLVTIDAKLIYQP